MLEGNGKSDPPSVIDDTARYLGAACCNGPPLISARIRASFLFSSFPPPSPPFVPRVDGERGWLQFTNNRLSPCSAVIAAQVPRISIRHVRSPWWVFVFPETALPTEAHLDPSRGELRKISCLVPRLVA